MLSALICRYYVDKGLKTAYYKAIQTGAIKKNNGLGSGDVDFVQNFSRAKGYSSLLFKKPASPHYASELENREIILEKLLSDYRSIATQHEVVISEGAGGLFVPLDRKGTTMGHLCREMGVPLILAGRAGLGTINHSALSLNYAKMLGIDRQAVFLFSDAKDPSNLELELDNVSMLKELFGIKHIYRLPLVFGVDVDKMCFGQMEGLYHDFTELVKEKDDLF